MGKKDKYKVMSAAIMASLPSTATEGERERETCNCEVKDGTMMITEASSITTRAVSEFSSQLLLQRSGIGQGEVKVQGNPDYRRPLQGSSRSFFESAFSWNQPHRAIK